MLPVFVNLLASLLITLMAVWPATTIAEGIVVAGTSDFHVARPTTVPLPDALTVYLLRQDDGWRADFGEQDLSKPEVERVLYQPATRTLALYFDRSDAESMVCPSVSERTTFGYGVCTSAFSSPVQKSLPELLESFVVSVFSPKTDDSTSQGGGDRVMTVTKNMLIDAAISARVDTVARVWLSEKSLEREVEVGASHSSATGLAEGRVKPGMDTAVTPVDAPAQAVPVPAVPVSVPSAPAVSAPVATKTQRSTMGGRCPRSVPAHVVDASDPKRSQALWEECIRVLGCKYCEGYVRNFSM